MSKQNDEIAPMLEPTALDTVYVSNALLQAVDRLVLRGQPTGEESAVKVASGSVLTSWPLRIQIGQTFLYMCSIYHKNGAQEAMYERRR